jgi:hypothetical protein
MRRRDWLGRVLRVGGTMAVLGLAGCSSSSASTLNTPGRDASTGPGGGDSGTTAGDGGGTAMTLYQRLGGHAGIRAKLDAVVTAELQDPEIASYFVFQGGAPGNGHPTADQIEECFTDFVASLPGVGGTESYPTTVTTDAGAFTCRSMLTIHQPYRISGGTFDTFVLIAGTSLQAQGVTTADLTTLTAALEGTQPQVVDQALADAGEAPFVPDAGADQ